MVELQYTTLEDIEKTHTTLRNGFRSGKSKSVEYRKYQLLQLAYMVKDNTKRFEDALAADLGRPPFESHFLEINSSIMEARTAWANVDKWAKPERPPFSINATPMRPVIYKEPKGVVLIISPFNYPMWLCISPLAGAIAAGNAIVIKPSEATPHVSALFAELVPKYLDPELIAVVNGAVPETTKLLDLPWDHILYTGGGRVGRIVSTAAAKHLTPVSLELGGKSPVFIDPNCDLETAAKRILWGKVVNAGQTCVAPDYVLVPRDFQDKFVSALKEVADKFYPESTSAPGIYSRLVTPQAFNRIKGLLDNTKGSVALGGETDAATKFISPTVVKDVGVEDSLMSEEIFGPVLPIVPVKDVDEAIAFVNSHDHPLALYVFSRDATYKQKVISSTQSGAAIVNEVVIHPGIDGLPFGGIGPSGHGYHTGKYSFDMFTHLRSSMDSPSWIDKILGFRFPPYNSKSIKGASRLLKSLPPRPVGPPRLGAANGAATKWWGKWFFLAFAVAVAGGLTKRVKILGALVPGVNATRS
ncbi:NAD-aldehyde dehydrogenase [Macrolepiota fuliginosa MF-IS2]|uniref:Aldehyde dehydrogenase n=1 Tax=Macrolepiota fuliginosa MF-IS2 TaxID=1400762 RepID=A0A9P5X983_9AGAR|nr:NAD-aldehyde dehydrogenase [Macrolepiota fuliginosa MF-IS2]